MTGEEYRILVAEWTEQDLERTMIFQNHILSGNVWIKHDALNWAIAFTIVALMLLYALGMAYGIVVANSQCCRRAAWGTCLNKATINLTAACRSTTPV